MFVTFATVMFLVAVCGAAPHADLKLEDQHRGTKVTDGLAETRGKRSPLSIFVQGANALTKLLKRTTRIDDDFKRRNFLKRGNYETALKDFRSVNPAAVDSKTSDDGVKVVTGVIGNKYLKLRSPGYKFSSEAVLDVYDFTTPDKDLGKPYIDSIIYVKYKKPRN